MEFSISQFSTLSYFKKDAVKEIDEGKKGNNNGKIDTRPEKVAVLREVYEVEKDGKVDLTDLNEAEIDELLCRKLNIEYVKEKNVAMPDGKVKKIGDDGKRNSSTSSKKESYPNLMLGGTYGNNLGAGGFGKIESNGENLKLNVTIEHGKRTKSADPLIKDGELATKDAGWHLGQSMLEWRLDNGKFALDAGMGNNIDNNYSLIKDSPLTAWVRLPNLFYNNNVAFDLTGSVGPNSTGKKWTGFDKGVRVDNYIQFNKNISMESYIGFNNTDYQLDGTRDTYKGQMNSLSFGFKPLFNVSGTGVSLSPYGLAQLNWASDNNENDKKDNKFNRYIEGGINARWENLLNGLDIAGNVAIGTSHTNFPGNDTNNGKYYKAGFDARYTFDNGIFVQGGGEYSKATGEYSVMGTNVLAHKDEKKVYKKDPVSNSSAYFMIGTPINNSSSGSGTSKSSAPERRQMQRPGK